MWFLLTCCSVKLHLFSFSFLKGNVKKLRCISNPVEFRRTYLIIGESLAIMFFLIFLKVITNNYFHMVTSGSLTMWLVTSSSFQSKATWLCSWCSWYYLCRRGSIGFSEWLLDVSPPKGEAPHIWRKKIANLTLLSHFKRSLNIYCRKKNRAHQAQLKYGRHPPQRLREALPLPS